MPIRAYRRPTPSPTTQTPQGTPTAPPQQVFEEMYVLWEDPILELTRKDLEFLRERGINPFAG